MFAEIANSGKVMKFTTSEWKGYAIILAPFEKASRNLCGEKYPTTAMKIPAINGLNEALQGFVTDNANRDVVLHWLVN